MNKFELMTGAKRVPVSSAQRAPQLYTKIESVIDLIELVKSTGTYIIKVNGLGTVGLTDIDEENKELLLFVCGRKDNEIDSMGSLLTLLETVPPEYSISICNGLMSRRDFRLHAIKKVTLAQSYYSDGWKKIMLEYEK